MPRSLVASYLANRLHRVTSWARFCPAHTEKDTFEQAWIAQASAVIRPTIDIFGVAHI
jgi:hypothetical protein